MFNISRANLPIHRQTFSFKTQVPRPRRKLRCSVWRGVLLVIRYTTCFGIVMWTEYTHTHTHIHSTKNLAKPISQHDASAALWPIKSLSFFKSKIGYIILIKPLLLLHQKESQRITQWKGFMVSICLFGQFFPAFFSGAHIMTKVIVESLWTSVSTQRFVGKNVFLRFMQPNIQRYKIVKSKNSGKFLLFVLFLYFFNYLILGAF